MTTDLTSLAKTALTGELEKLRDEIKAAVAPLTEQQFWTKPIDPGNSIGHLILHLTGNLSHFVGAQVGGTDYVRDRPREFLEPKPPPKLDAMAGLDAAVATFHRVVDDLTAEQLVGPHPEKRFATVLNCLVSVVNHFALHRGQISYLVRLVK